MNNPIYNYHDQHLPTNITPSFVISAAPVTPCLVFSAAATTPSLALEKPFMNASMAARLAPRLQAHTAERASREAR